VEPAKAATPASNAFATDTARRPQSTLFNKIFQPGQRIVPLARNLAEVITRIFQRFGVEFEETFAPRAFGMRRAGSSARVNVVIASA